jgi:pilus assembly protein CpaE
MTPHLYLLATGSGNHDAEATEQAIRKKFPHIRKIKSVDEALAHAGEPNSAAYVLLVGPTQNRDYVAEIIAATARYGDRLFFVLVGGELSAQDYKALTRTGSAEWISDNSDLQELAEIVSGRHERRLPEGSDAKRNAVAVSFVPGAGGVGNSTLAIEIAVHLKAAKATRQRDVCIVDLDFQTSHVCDYLDLEPRLKIDEISSNPERLDAQLFEIFVSRHSSGVHVFGAPRAKFDYCSLNVAALDKLFTMISARYDLVFIDLPLTWFGWTPQVIRASDGVVVTGINTIPGIRQSAEAVSEVRAAAGPAAKIAVAINRCERRMIGGGVVRRHHVESVLSGSDIYYVAHEPTAVESVNTGRPMGLAGRKELARLAAFCAALAPSVKSARERHLAGMR